MRRVVWPCNDWGQPARDRSMHDRSSNSIDDRTTLASKARAPCRVADVLLDSFRFGAPTQRFRRSGGSELSAGTVSVSNENVDGPAGKRSLARSGPMPLVPARDKTAIPSAFPFFGPRQRSHFWFRWVLLGVRILVYKDMSVSSIHAPACRARPAVVRRSPIS